MRQPGQPLFVEILVLGAQSLDTVTAFVRVEPGPGRQVAHRLDAVLDGKARRRPEVQSQSFRNLQPGPARLQLPRHVLLAIVWF